MNLVEQKKIISLIKSEFENIGITVAITDSFNINSSPDDIAINFGINGLGNNWISIDRQEAQRILTQLLHCDLAYNVERIPLVKAQYYSNNFLFLLMKTVFFLLMGFGQVEGKNNNMAFPGVQPQMQHLMEVF